MIEGQDLGHGDDESHTVGSAALALEGLLSDDTEDQQSDDATSQTGAPEGHEAAEDPDEEEQPSASEDESTDDEHATEEAPAQPRKLKVKVDGQELEVTEDEVLKGYSRTQDYTRKTQALAEERKSFLTEQDAVRAERQRYATQLVELERAVKSLTQEPDWDTLRQENPQAFPEVFANWQLQQKRIEAIEVERQKAVAAVQQDERQQHNDFLAAQRAKLVEAVPEWRDPEVSKKDRVELLSYGQEVGFTEDELHSVVDHRALVMLRKAMLFDRAEKARAAAATKGQDKIERAKVVAPGASGTTKPKTTETTRRLQRLAKTGSDKDAASVIELMLGD